MNSGKNPDKLVSLRLYYSKRKGRYFMVTKNKAGCELTRLISDIEADDIIRNFQLKVTEDAEQYTNYECVKIDDRKDMQRPDTRRIQSGNRT